MKPANLILLLAAFGASVAFIGYRVHAMNKETVNHFAELDDRSTSYAGGCSAVIGTAEELLRSSDATSRSSLTMLVSGDGATADEPREVATYSIPTSRRVIEGRHANESRRLDLLREIWTKCKLEQPASISPIFMGVKQSVAALRAKGCSEGSHCTLLVSSDLEENVEVGIKERLNNSRGTTPLPKALDNAGISIVFCGFADTAGQIIDPKRRGIRRTARRDPNHDDRLQRVWRSLFTDPDSVAFEPFCPKPTNPEVYATAGMSNKPRAHNHQ